MRFSLEISMTYFPPALPDLFTAGFAGFSGLAADVFISVTDTLALVRLGWTELANSGCDFADDLAVGSGQRDRHLLLDARLHARWKLVDDRMREPERQVHFLAACIGAVSDAGDLELARKPGRDAGHRVRDHAPDQALARALMTAVGDTRDEHAIRTDLDGRCGIHRHGHLAERTLGAQYVARDRHVDALRNGKRNFTEP